MSQQEAETFTFTLSDELSCFVCKETGTQSIIEGSPTVKQSSKTKVYFRLQTKCYVCGGDLYDYVWYGNIKDKNIIVTEYMVVPF